MKTQTTIKTLLIMVLISLAGCSTSSGSAAKENFDKLKNKIDEVTTKYSADDSSTAGSSSNSGTTDGSGSDSTTGTSGTTDGSGSGSTTGTSGATDGSGTGSTTGTSGATDGSGSGSTTGTSGTTGGSGSGSTTGTSGTTGGSGSGSTTGTSGATDGSGSGSTTGTSGATDGSGSGSTTGTSGTTDGSGSGSTTGTTDATDGSGSGTTGTTDGSTTGDTNTDGAVPTGVIINPADNTFKFATTNTASESINMQSVTPTTNPTDINKITIDGTVVTLGGGTVTTTTAGGGGGLLGLGGSGGLLGTGLLGGGGDTTTTTTTTSSGDDQTLRNLSYAVYGSYNEGSTQTFFSQGQVTASNAVPTTGVATYTGSAVVQGTGITRQNSGTSSFNVDFGNKTLTGTIGNVIGSANIDLSAKINGSSFAGSSGGTYTNGQFYGPAGEELSGTFINSTNSIGGAYGAKKQ